MVVVWWQGSGSFPCLLLGIGGDFLACLKALAQPPYNKVGPSELLIRLSPQKHPLVLVAVAALVGLLWDETGGIGPAHGLHRAGGNRGGLVLSGDQPVPSPQSCNSPGGRGRSGRDLPRDPGLTSGHQPTRLIVAALVLSFLFFGASAKPLSFKDPTRTETYGLSTAWRVLPPARCRLCPRWVISRFTPGPTIGP